MSSKDITFPHLIPFLKINNNNKKYSLADDAMLSSDESMFSNVACKKDGEESWHCCRSLVEYEPTAQCSCKKRGTLF